MPQQIETVDREKLFYDFDEKLRQQSKDIFLYDNYKVDCMKDKKEFLFTMAMYITLKNGYCELSEYICKSLKEIPQKKRFCKALENHKEKELPKTICITDIGTVEI